MFNLNMVESAPKKEAPIMILYAKNGAGKTSFLQSVPNIMVADIEGKLANSNTTRFSPKQYEDVRDWLQWCLQQQKLPWGALGIDSVDWLEFLINKNICKEHKATNINDPYVKATAFGNGNAMTATIMRDNILAPLIEIKNKFNIPIILVCHNAITTSKEPDIEPYDMHDLKLHEKVRTVLSERVDIKAYIKIEQQVDNKGNILPTKDRILITSQQKGIEAKNNRFLPDEIKISYSNGWSDFVSQIGKNKPNN